MKITIWKKEPHTNVRLYKAREVELRDDISEVGIGMTLTGAMKQHPDWAQIMLTKSHAEIEAL